MSGRRVLALVLTLTAIPVLAAQQPLDVKPDPMDRAVNRALAFLRRNQDPDGCWRSVGFGQPRSAGVTGLGVMAFLSAGQTPLEGEHARAVESGVRWVLGRQQPNGLIATDGEFEMYHHGICT